MIVLKDRFKSVISDEEIKKYKAQALRSAPKGGRIFAEKSAEQVALDGIKLAKKHNRKIVSEDKTFEL